MSENTGISIVKIQKCSVLVLFKNCVKYQGPIIMNKQ